MKAFKGKVAVITGAGRGTGRGIALHCARQGMKIVLAGIGMESLTKTNADLQAMGAETLVVQTDVSLSNHLSPTAVLRRDSSHHKEERPVLWLLSGQRRVARVSRRWGRPFTAK
jgi:NAD(P)-dependent dehydrogenase (short-subunit alcohol dehydrogenase family)